MLRSKRCVLCGRLAERHHWFSRGSLRGDAEVPENIVWLCRKHHSKAHSMGRKTFSTLYLLTAEVDSARQAIYNSRYKKQEKDPLLFGEEL